MKKVFSVVLLLLLSLSLFGCSSEPVPFSEKLRDGRDCYVDVTAIHPTEVVSRSYDIEGYSTITSYYFLCKCTTPENATVYMMISVYDYKDYIDPSINTGYGTLPYLPSSCELSETLRIFGTAINTPDKIGLPSLKRIFEFHSDGNTKLETTGSAID